MKLYLEQKKVRGDFGICSSILRCLSRRTLLLNLPYFIPLTIWWTRNSCRNRNYDCTNQRKRLHLKTDSFLQWQTFRRESQWQSKFRKLSRTFLYNVLKEKKILNIKNISSFYVLVLYFKFSSSCKWKKRKQAWDKLLQSRLFVEEEKKFCYVKNLKKNILKN